jgi:hypothetical protein
VRAIANLGIQRLREFRNGELRINELRNQGFFAMMQLDPGAEVAMDLGRGKPA